MADEAKTRTPLRAPLGFHPVKIDGAGRLKLPAKYLEYLQGLENHHLFATEYRGMARIFTNGSWERNLSKLDSDPGLKKRFAFRAESIGGDLDIDKEGRVTLPQLLRKELGLENEAVQIRFYEDVISIYSQEQYDAEKSRVKVAIPADDERLTSLGIDL